MNHGVCEVPINIMAFFPSSEEPVLFGEGFVALSSEMKVPSLDNTVVILHMLGRW